MCAAVTGRAPCTSRSSPLTHDTAIQRPAARAPFHLPSFETPTCFPSTHRYSNKAASAPGQLGLRQLGDPARQVSTLAPRAERRKSHGDGNLFELARMASSARHWLQRAVHVHSNKQAQSFGNASVSKCCTLVAHAVQHANAIKDHSPAALLASRVSRPVHASHLPQCRVPPSQAPCRPVFSFPAPQPRTARQSSQQRSSTRSRNAAQNALLDPGAAVPRGFKVTKGVTATHTQHIRERVDKGRGQAAGCLQNHKAAEKATLLTTSSSVLHSRLTAAR
ncbi:hypothetical protein ERJ75_001789800 [Trypanosoma vivax]|nr:hypothetical protein ERJ75_001789800 [Trypanosoma vivax]